MSDLLCDVAVTKSATQVAWNRLHIKLGGLVAAALCPFMQDVSIQPSFFLLITQIQQLASPDIIDVHHTLEQKMTRKKKKKTKSEVKTFPCTLILAL